MGKYDFWEVGKKYKGGTVTFLGNSPSVLTEDVREDGELVGKGVSLEGIEGHIWGINGNWAYRDEISLGFQADNWGFYNSEEFDHPRPDAYKALTTESKIPIVTTHGIIHKDGTEEIPDTMIKFPVDAFKVFGTAYMTETVSYMFACANLWGVKRINILGCDYTGTQRRPYERCGAEFWTGYSIAKGISVGISEQSALLKYRPVNDTFQQGIYGYSAEYMKDKLPEIIPHLIG